MMQDMNETVANHKSELLVSSLIYIKKLLTGFGMQTQRELHQHEIQQLEAKYKGEMNLALQETIVCYQK
jgi:hypothetical protein